MRFATRLLLVQLITQVCVVAVCAAAFVALTVGQLRAEAESSALNIARTVAASPQVRTLVTAYSADPGTPDAASLRDGLLESYARTTTERSGALFVVITDDQGIRLAHPDPDRLGEVVSTSFDAALAGQEVVTWETGTLGESARAKVPVYPFVRDGAPVGEVSVGFARGSVFDDLPAILLAIGVTVVVALALGAAVAVLMRRRLERLTLGLQPEDLAALVQTQSAVFAASDAGVVAVDPDGVVRVWSEPAVELLGVADAVGRRLDDLPLGDDLRAALREGAPYGVIVGERILYIDAARVSRLGRDLGTSAVVRDRTDVLALTERLESVRTLTEALRVERHEFANRLHAASGLIAAGRLADARELLGDIGARGAVDHRVPGVPAVTDPVLQSFVGAKAITAGERGVRVRVGPDTLLRGTLTDVEDALAVLGNLIDNAITAAASAPAPRWVEVTLLDAGGELVATVTDSGAGIDAGARPFEPRTGTAPTEPDAVHGHGIGLPLSRELARRRGGDVWIIDEGGAGTGAVFGMRLPGVMGALDDASSIDHEED
ncbi:ATP-binding protein [Microbacterium sp. 10M-3C3]|uniref:sensor histidine kinase n=1 Tax=Microbacterium sp. 10M-3C3 TaxID=2483401 RepID=UPI000F63807B|nr:ATP-binding protein [Microbacterium sp. 10M-3C3]